MMSGNRTQAEYPLSNCENKSGITGRRRPQVGCGQLQGDIGIIQNHGAFHGLPNLLACIQFGIYTFNNRHQGNQVVSIGYRR